MIDYFALALIHGLLLLALIRIAGRDDLDRETDAKPSRRRVRKSGQSGEVAGDD
ncbi:hypothetical protein [Pontixanthobacter luteolus]|uniref:hypothetical protein n=1 Tax=Pontixanthobacter luteolus TaxID=295089 RepID=UPI002304A6E9|nr:hypothetical protein [Pontixanthobacter luteolus]